MTLHEDSNRSPSGGTWSSRLAERAPGVPLLQGGHQIPILRAGGVRPGFPKWGWAQKSSPTRWRCPWCRQNHSPYLILLAQAPGILAAVNGCKMINKGPYNAWTAPPSTEIPDYVWCKKYDPKTLKIKSSKLIEIKIEEFYYPSKEIALRAAKMAVRGKSGMYFGSMENGKGFNVYRNGKVIMRFWVESEARK